MVDWHHRAVDDDQLAAQCQARWSDCRCGPTAKPPRIDARQNSGCTLRRISGSPVVEYRLCPTPVRAFAAESRTSRLGKVVTDEAHAALGMELRLTVVGDDAGGLLAAMLERVQAECGDRGCVGDD